MEATNVSIKQQSSISINVETLQAIKQRVLSAVVTRPLDACTASNSSLFTLHSSLKSLYRKELRLARAVAQAIDAHPTLSNIALWLMGIGIMVEIFLFA